MFAREEDRQGLSFWQEVCSIVSHAFAVLRMIERPDKIALSSGLLLMATISVCNTVFPLVQGRMLDGIQAAVTQNLTPSEIYRVAGFFLMLIAGVFLVREAIQVLRSFIVEKTCTRIEKAMTVNAFSHLVKIDLRAVTRDNVGALQCRISRDVVGFVRFIRLAFLDLLPPLFTGILALAVMYGKEPILGFAMTWVIPISMFLTLRQIRTQTGVRLKLMKSREQMDGTVVEQLGGLDYVRAANTHEYEVKRVETVAENRRAMELSHHVQMSFYSAAKAINQGFFHILLLLLSAYLAIEGRISFGDVLTFSFLFGNLMSPLNEIHRGLDEGHECSLSVADLLKLLDEPADQSFTPRDAREPRTVSGEPIIEIENLVVEYATTEGNKRVLDGVSVRVCHGETIGLAGPSGCGKTTWLRILMRLTPPTAGKVALGGAPIEAVTRDAIGRLVGYVSQSPFVFAGTIADNIRYGNPGVTDDAIREAAERACIHDEIMQMPGDYGAVVVERGRNLSTGQHQRLALARVFLKNPPILVLDEGTSALDTISERQIQRSIDLARKDRTIILVAHRLSTLLDADRIYVFQSGKIVETGTYADLYRNGGTFTELVDSATVGVTEQGHAAAAALLQKAS